MFDTLLKIYQILIEPCYGATTVRLEIVSAPFFRRRQKPHQWEIGPLSPSKQLLEEYCPTPILSIT